MTQSPCTAAHSSCHVAGWRGASLGRLINASRDLNRRRPPGVRVQKVASAGAATLSVPRGFSGCTPRPGSGLGVVQRGPNRVRRDGGKKKESHA